MQAEDGALFRGTRLAVEPQRPRGGGYGGGYGAHREAPGDFSAAPTLRRPSSSGTDGGGGGGTGGLGTPPGSEIAAPRAPSPVRQPPPPPPPPAREPQPQPQPQPQRPRTAADVVAAAAAAPPPPQQQRARRAGADGQPAALPAHLSLMLDRQFDSLEAAAPAPASAVASPRPVAASAAATTAAPPPPPLPFDRLSGLSDLPLAERAAAAAAPATVPTVSVPFGGGAAGACGRANDGGAAGGIRFSNSSGGAGVADTVVSYLAARPAAAAADPTPPPPPAARPHAPAVPMPRAAGAAPAGAAPAAIAAPAALARRLAAHLDGLAGLLRCPLTGEPFRDPVVASDGHTYERAAISSWICKGGASPLTGQALAPAALTPNELARALVREMAALGE